MKEADEEMVSRMLRRVSVQIDVNRINSAGMTALHQVGLGCFVLELVDNA